MKSLEHTFITTLSFTGRHMSTLKKIGEYRGKQALFSTQTPEILNSLTHLALIESSESSNRLEGITAPHKRVRELVSDNDVPQTRSEQEIAGYRDVLNIIHRSAQYLVPNGKTICDFHKTIYLYMPEDGGEWKPRDNEIVELHPDGSLKEVRFTPVSAEDTPAAIDTLFQRYTQLCDTNAVEPLVLIPLVVLDFLCIHPFLDGNGRVARLLTLLLLYHHGYDVARYISLERIFEETKTSYYATLYTSSQGWHDAQHDVFPWMTYFWGVLLRAYSEFEERVGDIRSGRGAKTEQVKDAVDRRVAPFAISDIEEECPLVSRDMIRVVLRQLRDAGVIEAVGHGRGAKWKKVTQTQETHAAL